MPIKRRLVLFSFMRNWGLGNRIAFIGLLLSILLTIFSAVPSYYPLLFPGSATIKKPNLVIPDTTELENSRQRDTLYISSQSVPSIPLDKRNDRKEKKGDKTINQKPVAKFDKPRDYYAAIDSINNPIKPIPIIAETSKRHIEYYEVLISAPENAIIAVDDSIVGSGSIAIFLSKGTHMIKVETDSMIWAYPKQIRGSSFFNIRFKDMKLK